MSQSPTSRLCEECGAGPEAQCDLRFLAANCPRRKALKLAEDILNLAGNEERIEVELAKEVVRLSSLSEKETTLTEEVVIGNTHFKPGVRLSTLVNAAQRWFKDAGRYNHLRTLAPVHFRAIWDKALTGREFDEVVDEAIKEQSGRVRKALGDDFKVLHEPKR